MTFDIRRLSHFIAAAEFGNINRAAESQHITQSALTRSIQVLEDELGAKLFERTPRGVTLTAIGKHLFDHARRIINAAAIAKSDMEALITGAGGEIRVGVAPPIATQGLMQLLFSLPRSLPMLSVSITEMFYDSLVQLLRSGELDLAISGIPETSEHSDLNVEPLARIPIRMRIVMRRDHPLASLKTITSEALQQANWVVPSQYHYLALLTRYFSERNMVPPQVPSVREHHRCAGACGARCRLHCADVRGAGRARLSAELRCDAAAALGSHRNAPSRALVHAEHHSVDGVSAFEPEPRRSFQERPICPRRRVQAPETKNGASAAPGTPLPSTSRATGTSPHI